MPVRIALWTVATPPRPLAETQLPSEALLEQMIVDAPGLLSDDWMLVGRQEDTGTGGRIDLLAVAPDGSLVLIELKRDRTPRAVVAQALDYAGWVEQLRPEAVAAVYARFKPGQSLAVDFAVRFGRPLDEATLNATHQIVVVAASLDAGTERIVTYLNRRNVPINVLCFQVFAHGAEKVFGRTWLLDPAHAQVAATTPGGLAEPWNGEFYCSFGDGPTRAWADAVEFEFVSAGGGAWYTRTLHLLNPGDRIWVKAPGAGFVGVGRVTGPVQPADEFTVSTAAGEQPVRQVATRASYYAGETNPEAGEYFVPVRWLQTVTRDQAVGEVGLFGNTNTVCQPTTPKWRATVERLKVAFPDFDRRP